MTSLDLKNKYCQLKDTSVIFQFTGGAKTSINGIRMYKVKMVDADQLIGTAWVRLDEVILLDDFIVKLLYKSK